jgi:hypothetical protein
VDGKIEQRVCIEFCVKVGKSAIATLEMLRKVSGEHSFSRTALFERHSRFKVGRVSFEDDNGSVRPSTNKAAENVEKIRELINEERRRTIHELTDTAVISYGVYQEILTGVFAEALLRKGSHSFYCYNYSVAKCLFSRCLAML